MKSNWIVIVILLLWVGSAYVLLTKIQAEPTLAMVYEVVGEPHIKEDELSVRAIIGEASNQGYKGMLAVACGIRNRCTLKGVYGVKAKHIDREPDWVWKMAEEAWAESSYNLIHEGTHWENVKAFGEPYWVSSMVEVYRHKDHIFYKEQD